MYTFTCIKNLIKYVCINISYILYIKYIFSIKKKNGRSIYRSITLSFPSPFLFLFILHHNFFFIYLFFSYLSLLPCDLLFLLLILFFLSSVSFSIHELSLFFFFFLLLPRINHRFHHFTFIKLSCKDTNQTLSHLQQEICFIS